MQIIGLRPTSAFRVDADYFRSKPHLGMLDLSTGGPLAVVEDFTDNVLPDFYLDYNPDSATYRQIIKAPNPNVQRGAAYEARFTPVTLPEKE